MANSMASCSNPTGLLEKNTLLRCDSVSDEQVTGEGSLAIVEISGEGVYLVMAVEVAAVEVAAVEVAAVVVAGVVVAGVVADVLVLAAVVVTSVVVAGVVVTAAGAEYRFVAAVAVVEDASKSMASLSTAAMSLSDVNCMSVIGYG